MRIKKDYAGRRRVPVNIAPSEPVDAAKMGGGSVGPQSPTNTEPMIGHETAVRARAARRVVPNSKLR